MEPSPKKNEVHDGDDRLTTLPDAILHHILSLSGLQIFDVVKLGVLSKRWNRLGITMPYLHIYIDDLYFPHLRGVPPENIVSFVNWVLICQGQSSLVRLRLVPRLIIHEVQVLRWLRAAVERNVQELDIEFIPSREFRLPLFVAVNDSLRLLKITVDKNVLHLPSVVRLNQLTFLELTNVKFSDSDMLQRLFSGCCSLESLWLNDCSLESFGFLDFSSTHLKKLIIGFIDGYTDVSNFEIKVSCPNLILFNYSGLVGKNYILENVSSLETACIEFLEIFGEDHQAGHLAHSMLKEVHNVTNLNCYMFVVSCLSSVIDELIRCPISFPRLKFLRLDITTITYETRVMFHLLDHCPNLEVLTIVSGLLEQAQVWGNEYWELQYEGMVSWKSHPHLKTIKFVDFTGSDHELDFLRFLVKNAKSLERMDIIRSSDFNISVEVIDEVLMFSKASSGIVVTFIDRNPDELVCNFEDMQQEEQVFM